MDLSDEPADWPVVSSRTVFEGTVVGVRVDVLHSDDGEDFDREVIRHPGAVAILAVDDQDRVLVVSQYRHALGERLVELPAGLLDVDGEEPEATARRELQEEGHVEAGRWSPLLTLAPSPGIMTETLHVFLAEEITHDRPVQDFAAEHEEAGMVREWVPLNELVAAVLSGRVKNSTTVAASLALWVSRHENGRSGPP